MRYEYLEHDFEEQEFGTTYDKFNKRSRFRKQRPREHSPKPKIKPYFKVRRLLTANESGISEIVTDAIESPLIEPFRQETLGTSLLTQNRASRIFNMAYAGANNQKKASLRFNGIIDNYIEAVNSTTPTVEATIGRVGVYRSFRGGFTNYLVACSFDHDAHTLLAEEQISLVKVLAPGYRDLHKKIANTALPHMSVAVTRYNTEANELANQLESTDLIDMQLEIAGVQAYKP